MSKRARITIVASFLGFILIVLSVKLFMKPHSISARDACIANLRQIDAAIARYELESSNRTRNPRTHTNAERGSG